MILYSTVRKEGMAEQIIEKSRFIAYVKPVSSKDEADVFISEIKKKDKDATHSVPAMVIGDKQQIQWCSDAGEPQGTSGPPIVQMLVSEGLTNIVVVVTRYYGGIKLGTGGLVRAYTGSAKAAIENASICDVKEMLALKFKADYSTFNRIQKYSFDFNFEIKEIVYTDIVEFAIVIDESHGKEVQNIIADISGGNAKILKKNHILEKIEREKGHSA